MTSAWRHSLRWADASSPSPASPVREVPGSIAWQQIPCSRRFASHLSARRQCAMSCRVKTSEASQERTYRQPAMDDRRPMRRTWC